MADFGSWPDEERDIHRPESVSIDGQEQTSFANKESPPSLGGDSLMRKYGGFNRMESGNVILAFQHGEGKRLFLLQARLDRAAHPAG